MNILKWLFNPEWFTFALGGGGGGPSSSSTSSTTVPKYLQPNMERLAGQAEALANSPYQTYGGERFAGFSDLQNKAFGEAADLGPASQLGQATDYTIDAANRAQAAGQYDTMAARSPYASATDFSPQQIQAMGLQQYQMGPAQQVGTGAFNQEGVAQSYMNPYVQASLNPQLQLLSQQFGQQDVQNAAQAAKAGAFGGSRFGVQNALTKQGQNLAAQQMIGSGYNQAYNQAAQQFASDQARALQAGMANQAAGLTVGQQNLAAQLGVQQLGSQQSLQAQLANQAAQQEAARQREQASQYGYTQGMNADQMREQSRQFGANLGLQGLQQQLSAAQQLGSLGQTQFGQQQAAMQARAAAGQQQQQLEQAKLQQQYQDFLDQRGWQQKQLGWLSDIYHGIPGAQTAQSMYQAPPSFLSQAAGLGFLGKGLGFFAEGGAVKNAPVGLADLALARMSGD